MSKEAAEKPLEALNQISESMDMEPVKAERLLPVAMKLGTERMFGAGDVVRQIKGGDMYKFPPPNCPAVVVEVREKNDMAIANAISKGNKAGTPYFMLDEDVRIAFLDPRDGDMCMHWVNSAIMEFYIGSDDQVENWVEQVTTLQNMVADYSRVHHFEKFQVVRWKKKMRNRKTPRSQDEAIFLGYLDQPVKVEKNEQDRYVGEMRDCIIVVAIDDEDATAFTYDSRMFEPAEEEKAF